MRHGGESARIAQGESRLGKLNASTMQAKQPLRQDHGQLRPFKFHLKPLFQFIKVL